IRDRTVTGVQTCALPILRRLKVFQRRMKPWAIVLTEEQFLAGLGLSQGERLRPRYTVSTLTELLGVSRERVRAWVKAGLIRPTRSEERRVGKECRSGWLG